MKLELKHLACYLPYNLRLRDTDNIYKEDRILTIESMRWLLSNSKPILRPIQDVELFFEKIWNDRSDDDVIKYFDADFLYKHEYIEISEIQLVEIESLPYGVMQLLFKYHFDVFGLIDKKLAIDINTLK